MTTDPVLFDVVIRRIPRHRWVRVFACWRHETFEPGHNWLYCGVIRRDAWTVGPLSFGIMRMPDRGVTLACRSKEAR